MSIAYSRLHQLVKVGKSSGSRLQVTVRQRRAAHSARRLRLGCGFTLVELLVVIASMAAEDLAAAL